MPYAAQTHNARLTGANPQSRAANIMRNQDMAMIRTNAIAGIERRAEAARTEMITKGHNMTPIVHNEAKGFYKAVCSSCGKAVYVKGGEATLYARGSENIGWATPCEGKV